MGMRPAAVKCRVSEEFVYREEVMWKWKCVCVSVHCKVFTECRDLFCAIWLQFKWLLGFVCLFFTIIMHTPLCEAAGCLLAYRLHGSPGNIKQLSWQIKKHGNTKYSHCWPNISGKCTVHRTLAQGVTAGVDRTLAQLSKQIQVTVAWGQMYYFSVFHAVSSNNFKT